jgi:hypothetical protein
MTRCEACGGSGWIVVERKGVSGAERCRCSRPPEPEKVSSAEILETVARIATSGVIPFFPQAEEAWIILTSEIQSFVTDRAALELFVRKLLHYAKKYEGPAQLRQIYCAFGVPADGEYPAEALAGFGPDEAEARSKMREMEENERRLAEYRKQALLQPPEERQPLLLPPVKSLSPPDEVIEEQALRRSLKEREDELAVAVKLVPVRSEEERRRITEEIQKGIIYLTD